jgi:hypothetical protein
LVIVRLRDETGGREVAVNGLAGSTRVVELLLRAAEALGVQQGALVALRCEAQWLKADLTLAEAGVLCAVGAVDLWVGVTGGMPGVFAAPGAEDAGGVGEELAVMLGSLLGRISTEVSGIEGAVVRLDTVHAAGHEPLATKQAPAAPAFAQVIINICKQ